MNNDRKDKGSLRYLIIRIIFELFAGTLQKHCMSKYLDLLKLRHVTLKLNQRSLVGPTGRVTVEDTQDNCIYRI